MNWRLSTRPFGSYVFLWIGLGLLLLTLLLVGRASSSRQSDRWVVHTLEILRALERFEASILQADLLSRPVPLSRETKKNVLNELAEARDAVERLAALTTDNPQQRLRVNQLSLLTDQASGIINIRVNSAVLAFSSPLLTGDPASTLPMIETIKAMREEERKLLIQRQEEQEVNNEAFWRTTIFAVILNIGLLWWAYLASRGYILERNEREEKIGELNRALSGQVAEVQLLNSSLEERIREKTSELEETVVKLRSTNAELERFAYVASHDLQEPLRQVASFNNLLSIKYGDRLDDTAQRYLSNSIAGARRLQLMIGRLLQYTVISSTPVTPATFPAEPLIGRVLLDFAVLIQTTGAAIDLNDTAGLLLTGDREMIRTVLESLISNAIRFRRKDVPPSIRIHFASPPGAWSVSVQDNGIGVDPRFMTRMFEMFSRYHAVGEYEGAGAGLAIARKIAEKHGGTLEVASNAPDPGCTFTARIPIAPGSGTYPGTSGESVLQ